jgi:hypothetical protein
MRTAMRTLKPLSVVVVGVAWAALAMAQSSDVERYVREHQAAIVREFMDLVAIPNVRTDLPNITRNADLLRQMLERRGMNPEVWTSTPTTRTCASATCGTGSRRWRRS